MLTPCLQKLKCLVVSMMLQLIGVVTLLFVLYVLALILLPFILNISVT